MTKQMKMVTMIAGLALSLGTAVAQTSVDRAVDAERLNSTLNRSNLQGGGDAATLKVGGLIQFRYHANWRSDGTATAPPARSPRTTISPAVSPPARPRSG